MKLTFYLDGNFDSDQHNELSRIFNDVEIPWNMPFLPQKDDYFMLDNFTDKVPEYCKEGNWKVDDREFVNENDVKLGLVYLD